MRSTAIILILLFILSACYRKEAPAVTYDDQLVVSRDTMELLLLDLHLIDGAFALYKRDGTKNDGISDPYFQMVLEKYDMSMEKFEESMKYYTYHVDEMDEMFEEVIIELGKMESETKIEK